MKTTALCPWFGSKRTMAADIVKLLGKHTCYWGLCAGSFAVELAKEKCGNETAVDLHGHLTNLAWVIQNQAMAVQLYDRLHRTLASESIFLECQRQILETEWADESPNVDRAYAYFVNSWLGRSGMAGTQRENSQIAVRWTKNGGSPAARFRSAVESIPWWHDRLRDFLILRRDIFEVLGSIEDERGTAIYIDPPYLIRTRANKDKRRIRGGGLYLHEFEDDHHERLSVELSRFKKARVVVSYYGDPLLFDLYPESAWTHHDFLRTKSLSVQGRRGAKVQAAPEVVIVNKLDGETNVLF